MTDLIDKLVHSPKLYFVYHRIGDILTEEQRKRQEFYASINEDDKAEFINGEIMFHSPVKLRHSDASGNLFVLLSAFVRLHNLGQVSHEKILISLTRNDYEPDVCYFDKKTSAQFTPDQMQFPAPNLIIEVLSPSTEERDRGVKFEDYAAHGVTEYWIIDPETETLEQYVLAGEQYNLMIKARSGVVTSVAVAGFEIPIRAIFDQTENMLMLQRFLAL